MISCDFRAQSGYYLNTKTYAPYQSLSSEPHLSRKFIGSCLFLLRFQKFSLWSLRIVLFTQITASHTLENFSWDGHACFVLWKLVLLWLYFLWLLPSEHGSLTETGLSLSLWPFSSIPVRFPSSSLWLLIFISNSRSSQRFWLQFPSQKIIFLLLGLQSEDPIVFPLATLRSHVLPLG